MAKKQSTWNEDVSQYGRKIVVYAFDEDGNYDKPKTLFVGTLLNRPDPFMCVIEGTGKYSGETKSFETGQVMDYDFPDNRRKSVKVYGGEEVVNKPKK